MTKGGLSILQVNAADVKGGAHVVAWNLFAVYRKRGYASWLAVGYNHSNDPDVFEIPRVSQSMPWARPCWILHRRLARLEGGIRGIGRLRDLLSTLAAGRPEIEREMGREYFNFPGSRRLLQLPPYNPDIVHAHNLHGNYFDLRFLPELSQQVPLVLTLHDAWLLGGHCAHSFTCYRWKTGCGRCPDLTIYPAIKRDSTRYNWRRKKEIYAKSRLFVATPSRWLMYKVEQSMLASAIVEARVIPNGVDLSSFHPADRRMVRARLGIPQDAKVLLFAANGIRKNIWKDYQTMRLAVARVAERLHGHHLLFITIGEDAPTEKVGHAKVRFIPYEKDPRTLAQYYQVADVYIHAAKAEVWGLTITEALACGTPVVATAIGGIPEQVKGIRSTHCGWRNPGLNEFGLDKATGVLVPARDAEAMATGIKHVLGDEALRHRLGENAVRDARQCFDLTRQAEAYLEWYQEIIERKKVKHSTLQFDSMQQYTSAIEKGE